MLQIVSHWWLSISDKGHAHARGYVCVQHKKVEVFWGVVEFPSLLWIWNIGPQRPSQLRIPVFLTTREHFLLGYRGTSDGEILANSVFGWALKADSLDLIADMPLPKNEVQKVFIADEAFLLQRNLMRPFPECNLTMEQWIFIYLLTSLAGGGECLWYSLRWRGCTGRPLKSLQRLQRCV